MSRTEPSDVGRGRHQRRDRQAQEVALAELGEGGVVGDRDRLVVGEQETGAAGGQHGGQGGDERQDAQPRHDQAVEDADHGTGRDPAEQAGDEAVGAEQGRDHAGHGGGRADREVDAAGHDHEAHAERDQREHGVVAQDRQDVEAAEEIVVAQPAEQDQQHQRHEHALAGQRAVDAGHRRGVRSCRPPALQPDRQHDDQRLDHQGRGIGHAVGQQRVADELDDQGAQQRADRRWRGRRRAACRRPPRPRSRPAPCRARPGWRRWRS